MVPRESVRHPLNAGCTYCGYRRQRINVSALEDHGTAIQPTNSALPHPFLHLGGSPFDRQMGIGKIAGVQAARFRLIAINPAMPAPTPNGPSTLGSGTAAILPAGVL